jgi:hypothetical protein
LLKRNPNSVASLIQATTISDVVRSKQEELERRIASQQQELDHAKESYEMKLRSMRQMHERLKHQYDTHVEELQKKISMQSSTSQLSSAQQQMSASGAGNPVKSLTQALVKIR